MPVFVRKVCCRNNHSHLTNVHNGLLLNFLKQTTLIVNETRNVYVPGPTWQCNSLIAADVWNLVMQYGNLVHTHQCRKGQDDVFSYIRGTFSSSKKQIVRKTKSKNKHQSNAM